MFHMYRENYYLITSMNIMSRINERTRDLDCQLDLLKMYTGQVQVLTST
jgi:hypothetical protein